MKIGVAKEIKESEYRVSAVPSAVGNLYDMVMRFMLNMMQVLEADLQMKIISMLVLKLK